MSTFPLVGRPPFADYWWATCILARKKKKDELSLFKWFNIYSEGMILMLLVSNLIHLCFAECILMLHYGSSTEGAYPITPF